MRKVRRGKKAFGAVCAAVLSVSLSAGMLTSYGATSYDWSSGADVSRLLSELSSAYSEDGPGAVVEFDDETEAAGPEVSQSDLTEKYHEEYDTYEESLEGLFFFYSSVGNGGITHEAVTLDIPANLTYTVEKDGLAWQYTPGQPITEYGTYVFRLCGVEDSSLPLSEQKEYRAVFRFRIQEKPPEPETEAAEEEAVAAGGAYSPSVIYNGQNTDGLYLGSDGIREDLTEIQVPAETEAETEAAEESTEETAGGEEGEASLEEETGEAETGESTGGEETTEAGTSGTGGFHRAVSQEYSAVLGKYQIVFENGLTLTANVPEGYMGAGPVAVSVPAGEEENLSVYLNDELIEHGASNSFAEPGVYRLVTGESAWSFAVLTYTNSLDIYPAPAGMRFREAAFDGEPMELDSDRYVRLLRDGQYDLVMEGAAGETISAVIRKDTDAPEVQVTKSGTSMAIQYLSDDIAQVRLEKDGSPVENFRGNSVSDPGSYLLTVTDSAGNSAEVSFTLKYQVNSYGIAAVILLILLAAGIAAFVIHTKKTVKVR